MSAMHPIEPDSPYFAEYVDGRRGEILDAALQVFTHNGYEGGTMRDIATRVGVSEPALYRHFSNKEELFVALLQVGSIHIVASVGRTIDGLHAKGLRRSVLIGIAKHRRFFSTAGPGIRNLLAAAARNPRFTDAYREAIIGPVHALILAKAAELDAAFGVPDSESTRDGRVRALMALVVGFAVSSFVLQDEPDEVVVDAALSIMGWSGEAVG